MCFTPAISMSIFVIEWILAAIVLSRRPSGKFRRTYNLAAIILIFLGFYQFTQYMFCTSGNFALWGMIGFLTYNLLPAFGVDFANSLVGKRTRYYLVYSIPIIFALIALLTPGFITDAYCSSYYIVAEHLWSDLTGALYGFYYLGFIIYTAYLFSVEARKNKKDRKIALTGLMGTLAFTIPVFILIIVFPALNIAFPSILCEFALLFAIAVFWMIYLIEKSNKR